jgi:hypothetical protein
MMRAIGQMSPLVVYAKQRGADARQVPAHDRCGAFGISVVDRVDQVGVIALVLSSGATVVLSTAQRQPRPRSSVSTG